MAVVVLLAFIGVFRLGEILALRLQDFDFVAPGFCIVTLLQTKARNGHVSVIVRDASLIMLFKAICRPGSPQRLLAPNKYRDFSIFLRKFSFFACPVIDSPGTASAEAGSLTSFAPPGRTTLRSERGCGHVPRHAKHTLMRR